MSRYRPTDALMQFLQARGICVPAAGPSAFRAGGGVHHCVSSVLYIAALSARCSRCKNWCSYQGWSGRRRDWWATAKGASVPAVRDKWPLDRLFLQQRQPLRPNSSLNPARASRRFQANISRSVRLGARTLSARKALLLLGWLLPLTSKDRPSSGIPLRKPNPTSR